jgi:hypothetical protein
MSWRRPVCAMLVFFMIHSGIARGQDKELDGQAKSEKQSLEEIKMITGR